MSSSISLPVMRTFKILITERVTKSRQNPSESLHCTFLSKFLDTTKSYLVTQKNDFFDFLESSLFSRNRFVIYLISIKVYSYQNNNVFHSSCLVFLSKPFKLYLFDVKHSAENVRLKLKTD